MDMTFKAVASGLLGAGYESLKKTLPVYGIVFGGLYLSGLRLSIRPVILYLLVGTFTAGVMWQTLAADNEASLQNLFMLPLARRTLLLSYVGALGLYTLLTKTAGLLAVVLALASWSGVELAGTLLCAANAVLLTAAVYGWRQYRGLGLVWAGAVLAAILLLRQWQLLFAVLTGNLLLAGLALSRMDVYAFYRQAGSRPMALPGGRRYGVWRYLLRYLLLHPNYLLNTAALWVVAWVLPLFLGRLEASLALPLGMAMLTLNTPLCILLSCDPALERAVRFLPGQKRLFVVPYGAFLFLCHLTAEIMLLCSWQLQLGGVTGTMLLAALFFALQSAVASVLLEWHKPIRGWKTEQDLWHHPRKYVVPTAMLLVGGLVGTLPAIVPLLCLLLAVEIIALLAVCWNE